MSMSMTMTMDALLNEMNIMSEEWPKAGTDNGADTVCVTDEADRRWLSGLIESDTYDSLQRLLSTIKSHAPLPHPYFTTVVEDCKARQMIQFIATRLIRDPDALLIVAAIVEQHWTDRCGCQYKDLVNQLFFWALPSARALRFIERYYNMMRRTTGQAEIIDLGSGSGAWTAIMRRVGMTAVPVDLPTCQYEVTYCPPQYFYSPGVGQILLVVWGGCIYDTLCECTQNGVNCVIILGERSGGCTLPCDLRIPNFRIIERVAVPSMTISVNQAEFICAHVRRGFEFIQS